MSNFEYAFGTYPPVLPKKYLPLKEPDADTTFEYDATVDVTFDGQIDLVISASLYTRPSGDGEIASHSVTLSGNIVNFWLQGGIAGRNYLHKLVLVTYGARTIEIFLGQVCDATPGFFAASPPPENTGFGTANVTTFTPSLFYYDYRNSGMFGRLLGIPTTNA